LKVKLQNQQHFFQHPGTAFSWFMRTKVFCERQQNRSSGHWFSSIPSFGWINFNSTITVIAEINDSKWD
jgi:hypothetical protein